MSVTTPNALTVENLTVTYTGEPAIEAVSFSVQPGERIAVIGPNGAGKSTLIKAVMGLLQPRSGTIAVPDVRRLGYVPQHEAVDWDFPVTVRDVVMMGRVRQIGWLRWPGHGHWQQVEHALERVGLAGFAGRQIGELSGGQRRRVFIARALAQEAHTLLLDEPFSGIDTTAQAGIMAVLDQLNADGLTIILSTHDLSLAFQRFDRVLALRYRLIADGPAAAVYRPEILEQLYGGRLATWQNGQEITLFIDDHHCP